MNNENTQRRRKQKRISPTGRSSTPNGLYSQSYASSYNDNTFYRGPPSKDANANSDLLNQALMPPSRLGSPIYGQNSRDNDTTMDYVMDTNRKSMLASGHNGGTLSSRRRTSSPHLNMDRNIFDDHNSLPPVSSLVGNGAMKGNYSRRWQIPIAVSLWYLLGVISISTTKMLLTDYNHAGMSPQFLTMQQFMIGLIFLRFWILAFNGKPPCPIPLSKIILRGSSSTADYLGYDKLIFTAIFYTLGFWFTNVSFSGADASFVETIKASEPISSATLAVIWGLEKMSSKEVYSLCGICIGVVISTLGNAHGSPTNGDGAALVSEAAATLMQSIYSSGIVMGANISFSFRGLYQKLFRASPNGNSQLIDDLNLQYRIHQVGITAMIIPLCVYELPALFRMRFGHDTVDVLGDQNQMWRFLMLSAVNGFAFTHYK